jgi:hypothetical protein
VAAFAAPDKTTKSPGAPLTVPEMEEVGCTAVKLTPNEWLPLMVTLWPEGLKVTPLAPVADTVYVPLRSPLMV